MDRRQKKVWARLFVGLALNIGLWLIYREIGGKGGAVETDVSLSLIGGSLAGATVVFVTPVFWRGESWQVPIAFVLVFFLPGLVIFAVVSNVMQYW